MKKNRKCRLSFFLGGLLLFSGLCLAQYEGTAYDFLEEPTSAPRQETRSRAPAGEYVQTYSAASYPAYSGPKITVAVIGFENKTREAYGSRELGEGLSEMLHTELLKTNRFILLERQAMAAILQEQEMGMSGLVRQGSAAPRVGALAGARFLIKGVVSEFQYKAGGGNLGFEVKGFNLGSKRSSAHVGLDIRLIDASSGSIIASEHASARADASGMNVGYVGQGGTPFAIKGGSFDRTPLGVATRKAMNKAVHFIIRHAKTVESLASVIKVSGDMLYVNQGGNYNVRVGDQFVLFSKGEALIDPVTGLDLGSEEAFSGTLVIVQVKPKYSIGRIERRVHGVDIRRGDVVKPR